MSKTVDWTIIENPTVESVIRVTSKQIARQFDGVIEEADLRQEAYILAATNTEIVRGYLSQGDEGYLSRWMWSRLNDVASRYAVSSNREVSRDFMELV